MKIATNAGIEAKTFANYPFRDRPLPEPEPVSAWYVDGMPAEQYHAHPALSSSGVRALLRSPARFRWERDHPVTPTREMELGTCVHTEVLGLGQEWSTVDAPNWRKVVHQERAAEIREQGDIPVLWEDAELINGMAAAIRAHPLAGPLLARDRGVPERALFWRDEATGVDCRALVDFSPHNRVSLVDLKTTAEASRSAVIRHMIRHGYPIQAAHYLRGARALGLTVEATTFVWVWVERDPPHLVHVVDLDPADLERANALCSRGMEIYRDCLAADLWPGYGDDITRISLPPWAWRDYEEQTDEY